MEKLSRKRTVLHPSGITFETPLLIPSFSSKGFKIKKIDDDEIFSEAGGLLEFCAHRLNDSILISAYDLYYKVFPDPVNLSARPEIIFLDSGGYETSDDFDIDEINKYNTKVLPWDREKLESIQSKWTEEIYSLVFVSYDCKKDRIPLEQQIELARINMAKYPNQLHDFLIKPETTTQTYVTEVLKKIIGDTEILKGFDIVGVTEKELGKTVLERMANIVRLREAIDRAKLNTPIHIFGSLDPITTPLYYIAGAEIFDGLSWLRYGYHNGVATNIFNYNADEIRIHNDEYYILGTTYFGNLSYMKELELQMKDYYQFQDFKVFKYNSDLLEECYHRLLTKLEVK